jgi:hypothetical protein
MQQYIKQPLGEQSCDVWDCRRPATHVVMRHDWRTVGKFCEQHADHKIAMLGAYDEAVDRIGYGFK